MDVSSDHPQFKSRHRSQSTNDRSESYHLRQSIPSSVISEPSQFHPSYRQNMPTKHRATSSPTTPLLQHEALPNLRSSNDLHFEYHARYPSPTEATFPTSHFAYHASSAQRSMKDQTPNHRRTASSPPPHPSPAHIHTFHRPTGSSSSSDNSTMFTLPPISNVSRRQPTHRGVDQAPNHQRYDIISSPPTQRSTQLQRDHPEHVPLRRHTLESPHIPDQQIVSITAGRKRTVSSLPLQSYPVQPRQPSNQINTSPYTPPPRRDNPPIPTASPAPPSPSTSHHQPLPSPSLPSLSQPTINIGEPPPLNETLVTEAVDMALEPFRLSFETAWGQAVQNVRQVMNKMQKDLTRLLTVERRKNAHLMRCLITNSEKFNGQEWAAEELRKENSSLKEQVLENGHLRRENAQKLTVIDAINLENDLLRRDNDVLKKKNEEMQETLTRAFFQYKEDLAKAKADVESLRKSSSNDGKPQPTVTPSSDRELTRLHVEKKRERMFNDVVKQLRALTALENSNPDTIREYDSEETGVVQSVSTLSDIINRDHDRRPSSEVSSSKQNSSSSPVINHHPKPSTPPPSAPKIDGDKSVVDADNREMAEVGMDVDDDVMIVPPTVIKMRATTSDPSNTEHLETDIQQIPTTDETRKELEAPSDFEIQRQRGPTPPPSSLSPLSSPQANSRKISPETGMKRNRDEYEDNQEREYPAQPLHGPKSAETEADGEKSDEGEILSVDREQKKINNKRHKPQTIVTDSGRQVNPQLEIQIPTEDARPKDVGRWSYYTHRKGCAPPQPRPFTTQPSTSLSPSPQDQSRPPKRHPKIGINHMGLLYKTEKDVMICRICLSLEQSLELTAAQRRKTKTNTKKFPLNASWADLINHCQTEHTKACEDMEKLSPSQLAEMKQRTSPVSSLR